MIAVPAEASEIPEEWKDLLFLKFKQLDVKTLQVWMEHREKYVFINWRDDSIASGRTMLQSSILFDRPKIALLLMDNGANPNIGNWIGT